MRMEHRPKIDTLKAEIAKEAEAVSVLERKIEQLKCEIAKQTSSSAMSNVN